MKEFTDGQKVLEEIKAQTQKIIDEGRTPEVIVMGNYYYYLLKDHHNRNIEPTTNRYFQLLDIEILGHKLDIIVKPKTIGIGFVVELSRTVEVYGR